MMQDQSFRQAFDITRQQTEERLVFLEELSVREGNITAAAAKLGKVPRATAGRAGAVCQRTDCRGRTKIYGLVPTVSPVIRKKPTNGWSKGWNDWSSVL